MQEYSFRSSLLCHQIHIHTLEGDSLGEGMIEKRFNIRFILKYELLVTLACPQVSAPTHIPAMELLFAQCAQLLL
jgi:hypothetical protein